MQEHRIVYLMKNDLIDFLQARYYYYVLISKLALALSYSLPKLSVLFGAAELRPISLRNILIHKQLTKISFQ